MAKNKAYLKVNGGKALQGDVDISGSKNSILALIPAMCLGEGEGILTNAPKISDVDAMKGILDEIGMNLTCENNLVRINGDMAYSELSKTYVSKIRASNLFLGVLLAKFGKAKVPISGGDKIGGSRPIDIHLYVFEKFGVKTKVEKGYVICEANQFPYKGQNIFLKYPSVGATENAMLIACAADSDTTIYNVAMEPEIVEMAVLLNAMGARISGAGTPVIHIKPAENKLRKTNHEVIPDRLEVGTYLFMIAATKGYGRVNNVIPEHAISMISVLSDSGVDIKIEDSSILVDARHSHRKPINIDALPFPGFPTDLQPFASVYASVCDGKSTIRDTVYNGRFAHLFEMSRMGLMYESIQSKVVITGNKKLTGSIMEGTDIRMAVSLVMAALIAEGESKLYGLNHIERGYDNLVPKLLKLGADITVVDEDNNEIVIQKSCM